MFSLFKRTAADVEVACLQEETLGGVGVDETLHDYDDEHHNDHDNAPLLGDSLGDTAPFTLTPAESRDLQRGLEQRHLSMLAIAGAIGTGLFLGLGASVQRGGPLGALLGYLAIGAGVCAVQYALGEVAALLPVTGSFVRHAEVLVDPAAGFAVGWNIVYGSLLSVPTEITAMCVLFEFWWPDTSAAVWIVGAIALTTAVGCARIRVFGEIEFVCALLKVALVVALVVLGLVVDLGGVPGTPRIGLRYWHNPGPFVEYIATGALGRFLGVWSVLTTAVFSFAGVESLAMAAAETRHPQRSIPRACQRVFARILLFYGLAVLVVGLLVASNDPRLRDHAADGTAAQSPFVIAAAAAGLPAVPSIVNAVVITSAWSSSNQALLAGSRVLYGLALKGQAPAIFRRTASGSGVPYMCVALYAAFMLLSFMSLSDGALAVFFWLVNLTAAGVLVSWITVLLNHVRLRLALQRQGIPASRLPWSNWWTVYSSSIALVFFAIVLLTSGFAVFTPGNWDTAAFVAAYLDIPLVLTAYVAWKLIKKTRIVALDVIPLSAALEQADQYPDEPPVPAKGIVRLVSWLWD